MSDGKFLAVSSGRKRKKKLEHQASQDQLVSTHKTPPNPTKCGLLGENLPHYGGSQPGGIKYTRVQPLSTRAPVPRTLIANRKKTSPGGFTNRSRFVFVVVFWLVCVRFVCCLRFGFFRCW